MLKKKHRKLLYPFTNIPVEVGDIIYSSLGRSTYFVGHSVIVGSDFLIKETIPGQPSGHELTIEQLWSRHHTGDWITILRSTLGASEAARWATENVNRVEDYSLLNNDMHCIRKNYCYKFVAQAYYLGAGIVIAKRLGKLLLPNDIKESPQLEKVAIISVIRTW